MYASVVKKQSRKGEGLAVAVSNISAVLGVVMGVIGKFSALIPSLSRGFVGFASLNTQICQYLFLMKTGAKMALEK
jgi:hypothetical protein